MQLKIHTFRFLTTDDIHDSQYKNWSRAYEYPAVLEIVKQVQPALAHNTSCGSEPLHRQFADRLVPHIGKELLNSDIVAPERQTGFINYHYYDITRLPPHTAHFDAVINISTVEHLPPEYRLLALSHLLMQTKAGGHVIITMDYPRVPLMQFCDYLGMRAAPIPKNVLTGANSIYPNHTYANLRIVLLHIEVVA